MDNHPAMPSATELAEALNDDGKDPDDVIEDVIRVTLTKALRWAAEVAAAIVDERRSGLAVPTDIRTHLLSKLSPCNYVSVSSRTCEHGTDCCTVKHGGPEIERGTKGPLFREYSRRRRLRSMQEPDRYIDVTRAELHADPKAVLDQPPGTWVRVRNPDGSVSSVMGTPHAAASDEDELSRLTNRVRKLLAAVDLALVYHSDRSGRDRRRVWALALQRIYAPAAPPSYADTPTSLCDAIRHCQDGIEQTKADGRTPLRAGKDAIIRRLFELGQEARGEMDKADAVGNRHSYAFNQGRLAAYGRAQEIVEEEVPAAAVDESDETERMHWTRGYAAAMGAIYRCFHQGDDIRKTMLSDGITIEQMDADGAQEFDLRSIREALGRKA